MPLPTPTTAAAVATSTSSSSSRWCPTPEQLMILEEMYRTGIRTPNASQIQQITAHLLSYGKIEGKNVFYWFQNHKARDRQRLRRKLSKQLQHGHHHHLHHHHHQLCFQQLPNQPPQPSQQQPRQRQLFNHQHGSISNCFVRYVNKLAPVSHSSRPGHACCGSNSFQQGGMADGVTSPQSMVSSKWPMKGSSAVDTAEAGKMSGMKICGGSLECILAMDMTRSCLHYLPQPLKTLDLFPTTVTNLKEECNLRHSI
ncbi:hypothetical protein MLD38_017318 [Melastoma candidum]|uniref:Uncharacterized protein n=1 Tax=Melastoma candidum TaxID=119954 RepID=A0ACB9QQE7_9MYRT|nr:hypothetical protein MLD38_017318 [Melastoma candidum]